MSSGFSGKGGWGTYLRSLSGCQEPEAREIVQRKRVLRVEPLHAFDRADRVVDHARGSVPRDVLNPSSWSPGHIAQPSKNKSLMQRTVHPHLDNESTQAICGGLDTFKQAYGLCTVTPFLCFSPWPARICQSGGKLLFWCPRTNAAFRSYLSTGNHPTLTTCFVRSAAMRWKEFGILLRPNGLASGRAWNSVTS